MKKILIIVFISACFSNTTWEKGLGVSATYYENENAIEPGLGVNINFMPTFAKYNDNLIGLKLDIFISGMIYHEESTGLNDESWDLNINQIQTIDLIYRRNFKSGNMMFLFYPY